jgi:hypothetical protein
MKKVFVLIPAVVLIFTCCFPAQGKIIFSNPTDYFRSVAIGDWSATTTWESSPDNTNWFAATLVPTSTANTISIRNTHTVTVNTNESMDQLIIESGGILLHSANTLTVNDGTGDDIIVQGGGIFTLASNSNGPVFSGTATANINTAGMLRLSATGLTAAGAGVHASNYVYSNASVLEYTLNFAFSTMGVTFFPNVDAVTIPVFRITNNVAAVGSNTFTAINGLFEANGNVTFQFTGTKTFRNGIIGTGNITGDPACGKFVISGTTASLGGTGSLTLPTAGMDIGTSSTVTMVSDKAVTGNIAFLANSFIMLGIYNLTMTGTFSGFSSTAHVVTNSTGKLVMNNVAAFPMFSVFPIGGNTTTYNPVAIANADGLNFGARVEIGIIPSIRYPIAAVNRTWVVWSSATPVSNVNVNFIYSTGHGNAMFNYTNPLEQGFYTGVWNVINTGLVQAGGPPTYQVATIVSSFAANTDAPMVLGNIPAILVGNNSVQLIAQKQNDKTVLNWMANSAAGISKFIAERSADGRIFIPLGELTAVEFSYTDMALLPGLNYYRIKLEDKNGGIMYSNIAVILNVKKGFELISISPNPVVTGNFKLNVIAAQKMQVEILITDIQGRLMQRQMIKLVDGFNAIEVSIKNLSSGTYQLFGITAEGRSKLLRFVIQ